MMIAYLGNNKFDVDLPPQERNSRALTPSHFKGKEECLLMFAPIG